jgi:hypothetical protein
MGAKCRGASTFTLSRPCSHLGMDSFLTWARSSNTQGDAWQPGVSIEILDLRHFAAPMLRPVLDAEGELWKQRLHWDYRTSSKLLMQYLDSHMLPGYAALEAGQVTGYAFCVYEETKAVIGDVFALSCQPAGWTTTSRDRRLRRPQAPARRTRLSRRCSSICLRLC